MSNAVLPVCYLPPVSYFIQLLKHNEILLDTHEYFIKQTYRSRCKILGVNKVQDLIVPVNRSSKMPMHEVNIVYDGRWQFEQWHSIISAYRSAPYFEYYDYKLEPVFKQQTPSLVQHNLNLLKLLCKLLKMDFNPVLPEAYVEPANDITDLRGEFTPKKETTIQLKEYTQVFAEKHPFIPDLSIIDALFNLGPGTLDYLKSHV